MGQRHRARSRQRRLPRDLGRHRSGDRSAARGLILEADRRFAADRCRPSRDAGGPVGARGQIQTKRGRRDSRRGRWTRGTPSMSRSGTESQRTLIIQEAWNTFGDIGAAIRSTSRKQAEAADLANVLARDDGPTRVAVVWVVRASAANRTLFARYPRLFSSTFDGSSRRWVRALTDREPAPERPGLVWFDPSRRRIPLGVAHRPDEIRHDCPMTRDIPDPFDFGRFEALTFDCYGTLIDWEAGLATALRRLLGPAAATPSDPTRSSRRTRASRPRPRPPTGPTARSSPSRAGCRRRPRARPERRGDRRVRRLGRGLARVRRLPGRAGPAQDALPPRRAHELRRRPVRGLEPPARRRLRLGRHRAAMRQLQAGPAQLRGPLRASGAAARADPARRPEPVSTITCRRRRSG